MKPAWALSLSPSHAGALGALRCDDEIEVAATEQVLWLRGDRRETLDRLDVGRLPATARYHVNDAELLVPVGRRLPVGRLPDETWLPIRQWMEVSVPTAALPGRADRRVQLGLRPGGPMREPNLLMTSIEAASRWAEIAPQMRLDRLTFSTDASRQRLVFRGSPVPAAPGQRYVVEDRIALPAGYVFDLPMACRDAAELLGLGEQETAVFNPDRQWSRLLDDDFVAVDRATLREIWASSKQRRLGAS